MARGVYRSVHPVHRVIGRDKLATTALASSIDACLAQLKCMSDVQRLRICFREAAVLVVDGGRQQVDAARGVRVVLHADVEPRAPLLAPRDRTRQPTSMHP